MNDKLDLELDIDGSDGSEVGELIFTNPVTVFDKNSSEKPIENSAPKNVKGWVSWFRSHPNLETSKPIERRVGGRSAVQLDINSASPADEFSAYYCGAPCVLLYPSGDSPIVTYSHSYYVNVKDRFVILDVQGETVVINVAAPEDKFDEFVRKAQEVLDTVEWERAQKPSSGADGENQ
jgi:hypothetical protein